MLILFKEDSPRTIPHGTFNLVSDCGTQLIIHIQHCTVKKIQHTFLPAVFAVSLGVSRRFSKQCIAFSDIDVGAHVTAHSLVPPGSRDGARRFSYSF